MFIGAHNVEGLMIETDRRTAPVDHRWLMAAWPFELGIELRRTAGNKAEKARNTGTHDRSRSYVSARSAALCIVYFSGSKALTNAQDGR